MKELVQRYKAHLIQFQDSAESDSGWDPFQRSMQLTVSGLGQSQGKLSPLFTLTQIGSEVSCSGFLQYSLEKVRCLFSLVSTKSLMHSPKFMAQVYGKRGWQTPPKCFHRSKVGVNLRISGLYTRTSPHRNVGDFQSLKFVLNSTLEFATPT